MKVDLTKLDLTNMRFTFTARLMDGNDIDLTQQEQEIKSIERAKEIAKDTIEHSNGSIEHIKLVAYAWLPQYGAEYGVYAALISK